uniref:Neur_chan_LBD domain-containing protein n=1 Tax=Heterorhabditis bacteriophora TaxID=37862 RepID=A0A1I7WGV5_HETBA
MKIFSSVKISLSFSLTVDLHFLRQHMDLTDLIWVEPQFISHLPHRFLVISEDLLLNYFSNARSVHGPGSSTPRMVFCFILVTQSFLAIAICFSPSSFKCMISFGHYITVQRREN